MSIDPETVIIGLTGSLGSGCTYLAGLIKEKFEFPSYKLSKIIRDYCEEKGIEKPDISTLQTIGNELRARYHSAYLVEKTLEEVAESGYSGTIILDGIKNVGEIKYLKKYPNFYLISPHAEKDNRRARLPRLPNFDDLDQRDQDDDLSYGQQVRKCVYYSDIIIDNSEVRPPRSGKLTDFINETIIPTVGLITGKEKIQPTAEEALMTLAYVLSLRSNCLKRKVGAVITTPDGDIVSTGYNEVPFESGSCSQIYGQCYKDKYRIEHINKIKVCPVCGGDLTKRIKCPKCGNAYDEYKISCGEEGCEAELEVSIKCEECPLDIVSEFGIKDMSLCRSLHAEENAILKLTKFGGGVSLNDASIYVTTFPCKLCANKIRAVGIKKVFYVEPYPDPDSKLIFGEDITFESFYGVKSNAYFRLFENF